MQGVVSLKIQSIQALMAAPLLVMYFLAKKSYVRLYRWARLLRPNPADKSV